MSKYSEILADYKAQGRLRVLPSEAPPEIVDLSSNDYLGLADRRSFAEEFLRGVADTRFSSVASRLLASRQSEYEALEAWLGGEYGKAVLLFNSGYHANTGCVSALAIAGTTIVADKLVHASIIDGIRLSGAPFRRFRHNDTASLRRELEKASAEAERVLVIVESVYSMDGDIAPLREIVALKQEFSKMMLYVDEAHALGVFGERGLGVCEELGILDSVDLFVGTFGKACASMGAFAATNQELKDFLLNSARSFIFSTALPPLNVAYTLFMLKKIKEMSSERRHLADISRRFRDGVAAITGSPCVSESQIVPLMAGSNEKALAMSAALKEQGVLALPIRKPTVPAGTERIRFSLNASLSEEVIDRVLDIIARIL